MNMGRFAARLACLLLAFALFGAAPAVADVGDVGYHGPSYVGTDADPTGEKPESKLWWNDGSWWASMWDEGSSAFRIFRLDVGTQPWVDTGVTLDTRAKSRADVLWDAASGKLYVASHVFRKNTGPSSTRNGRLWRFSYDALKDTYSLESGFPVDINQSDSETLVIEKDSTGRLWATWVEESPDGSGTYRVFVSHTLGSDTVWETPFVLPVAGA